jgi:hypothetical protein
VAGRPTPAEPWGWKATPRASLQSCYFAAAAQAQEREIEREKRAGKREIERETVRRRKEEEKRKKRGCFPPAQTRPERDIQRRERVGARREKPKEQGECSPAQPEQERKGGKKEREGRTVVAGSPEMGDGCVSGDVAADRPSVGVRRPLW